MKFELPNHLVFFCPSEAQKDPLKFKGVQRSAMVQCAGVGNPVQKEVVLLSNDELHELLNELFKNPRLSQQIRFYIPQGDQRAFAIEALRAQKIIKLFPVSRTYFKPITSSHFTGKLRIALPQVQT